MELAFLDLLKLSPRLPSQRAWMCGSPTLAFCRNGQFMPVAERVLDAYQHAASSLAALDRCYTYLCLFANP
jgi:hypothetical protein